MLVDAPIRKQDRHGSGEWQASRGTRKHNGIDIACQPKTRVLAVTPGIVTKIGYPYPPNDPKKGHLRYVQITDANGNDVRYFYVDPMVKLQQAITKLQPIGTSQPLQKIYPGITDHFHFEIKRHGEYLNPYVFLDQCKTARE